jgi:hypothetical protein
MQEVDRRRGTSISLNSQARGWVAAIENRICEYSHPQKPGLRRNGWVKSLVYSSVLRTCVFGISVVLLGSALGAAYTEYATCQKKFDLIESGHLHGGSHIELTPGELTAYAAAVAPPGVRNPQLHLTAPGMATGSALVDFGKLRRSQGYKPGWLMSKLLDGERPVSVTARIHSEAGHATVDVQSVEISGMTIDGRTLDFLIQNFLLAMYPTAAVGRPFELGHNIRKVDVLPRGVIVYM